MVLKRYIKGIVLLALVLSLVIIVIAAPLSLTNGSVAPTSGDTTTTFVFNVNYTDGANGTADYVRVDVDGIVNDMNPVDPLDTITSDGKLYTLTLGPFANATHYYNFTAKNGTDIVGPVIGGSFVVDAIAPIAPVIDLFNPPSPTTTIFGNVQAFNVTMDQMSNVTWTIDGVSVFPINESVPIGIKAEYINDTAGIGAHTVTATASNGNGTSSPKSWDWNVIASPGPDPVTGLSVSAKGATWIEWTWTNPGGSFNHTIVSINSTFQENTSNNSYNYTNFGVGTLNTISLQTVDTSGIVNSTIISNQASTFNTQTGNNINLTVNGTLIIFSQVNSDGDTNVISYPALQPGWGTPAFQKVGNYYDITTSAVFYSGNITVELPYDPTGINESTINIYHWNNATSIWDDVTTNLDQANNKVTGNVNALSPFVVGIPPSPVITKIDPNATNLETIVGASQKFSIRVDQTTNITWSIAGTSTIVGEVSANTETNFTYTPSSSGNYTLSVTALNMTNGASANTFWNWTVQSKTFRSGNRIWDENKGMSTTYTWTPYSFSGFYYNLDDNLGTENLTMMNIDRNLAKGDVIYSTSPFNVNFTHTGFGSYQVIGFMADKYFAGYTTGSVPSASKTISTIGSSQLHKVLFDDDDKRTITEGGTLTLMDGYVLKMTAVDVGAGSGQIWVTLLKDGNEVDSDVKGINEDYIYSKKVGGVNDLPIIVVHFDTVFRGREVNAAFIRGIFQISESYTSVKSGDKYGVMQIDSVSATSITMNNQDTVDLSAGRTVDLMGNLKIDVADNSSVLRFGLSVVNTGTYEVRGTIYNVTSQWTPMNFGMNVGGTSIGFYYDIDSDIGNETLWIAGGTVSGTSLPKGALQYSTTPQDVSFQRPELGSFQVMGFMAEKYFGGYTSNSKPSGNKVISTIGSSQLHKVLLDDNDKRTITEGGTLTLSEGYVLKMTAVDVGAGAGQIWVTLLKDGSEVDQDVLTSGEEYIYAKKVGVVNDLPIVVVHFDSVFRGREVNAAFIKGVFQISEIYTQIKSDNRYGAMRISGTSNGIQMENENTIDLGPNQVSDVMGNIKFRTADSSTLRFYPFVEVTQDMIANQLVIDAPAKANAGDNITIKVTAGGNVQEAVSVLFGTTDIGQTNTNGSLVYTIPKTIKGNYTISASKLGFEKATKSIDVALYVDYRLSIEAPATANRLETISIKVLYNGTPMSGASLTFDNASIGSTDINGIVNYTLDSSGTHTISASKINYITAVREIQVKELFSEFKAIDINITPAVAFMSNDILIRSNISNVGTKADTLPVNLLINETLVDSKNLTLAPGETKEVNFTRKGSRLYSDVKDNEPGNYSVEIQGQKGMIQVQKDNVSFTTYLLIAGIITALGIIAIYFLTAKNTLTLDVIKSKFANLGQQIKNIGKKPQ